MAQRIKPEFFPQLLAHEIKELSRIKRQLNLAEHIPAIDNITVAVVPLKDGISDREIEPVERVLRDSDVIFPADRYLLLLLPGTDEMGAMHILEGIADFLEGSLRFTYVVYPQDGQSAEQLIDSLKEKSRRELGIDIG